MGVHGLLMVLCCSGVLAAGSGVKFSCVSDYVRNISCVLNITDGPLDSTYRLKFTDPVEVGKSVLCPLTARSCSYVCDCQVKEQGDFFANFHQYIISLCAGSSCCELMADFEPYRHIQLNPPPELAVQQTPETVNVTCRSVYDHHMYLSDRLHFQLVLQRTDSSEQETYSLSSPDVFLSIDGTKLEAGSEYCLKARYEPESYSAVWSDWSRETCWRTRPEEDKNILVTLVKSVGPLCILCAVLLFILCSPAARMKMKTLSHTPSPAPFFQPLFQQHNGNLQDWLSPAGRFEVLAFQTEEVLPTHAVTVLPKPPTKEPEEAPSVLGPADVQLEFARCHGSYVGLPGMEKAPPPPTMICTVDSSYTQLPCSFWEFSVPSRPADLLEVSQADSGCSCEDLSQSPECSLPSSPVHDSPPPSFCSDYCILNKTAGGVVPVLMSKESRVKIPSELLQEEEEEEEEEV